MKKVFTCSECLLVCQDVPLLTCGCFICPNCYVKAKQCKINNCKSCNTKLRRK